MGHPNKDMAANIRTILVPIGLVDIKSLWKEARYPVAENTINIASESINQRFIDMI